MGYQFNSVEIMRFSLSTSVFFLEVAAGVACSGAQVSGYGCAGTSGDDDADCCSGTTPLKNTRAGQHCGTLAECTCTDSTDDSTCSVGAADRRRRLQETVVEPEDDFE